MVCNSPSFLPSSLPLLHGNTGPLWCTDHAFVSFQMSPWCCIISAMAWSGVPTVCCKLYASGPASRFSPVIYSCSCSDSFPWCLHCGGTVHTALREKLCEVQCSLARTVLLPLRPPWLHAASSITHCSGVSWAAFSCESLLRVTPYCVLGQPVSLALAGHRKQSAMTESRSGCRTYRYLWLTWSKPQSWAKTKGWGSVREDRTGCGCSCGSVTTSFLQLLTRYASGEASWKSLVLVWP